MAAVRAGVGRHGRRSLVEKIVAPCVVKGDVRTGEFVQIQPKYVMTHDNTAAVMKKFATLDAGGAGASSPTVADPKQIVFTLDHNVQDKSETNLKKYRSIADFANGHGINHYPAGRGIGHQVLVEEGYVLPGSMVVASDSHSNMYGGLGCLGTPVVRTDAACIWKTGQTWWQVPPIGRIRLTGSLQRATGATSKDVIIALCGLFNHDEVLNHAIEFTGPGVKDLTVDDRLTVANMTTEWGAIAGVFPLDAVTMAWLEERAGRLNARGNRDALSRLDGGVVDALRRQWEAGALSADEGAEYAVDLELDISTVRPHVSGPNHVKTMSSVKAIEAERVAIQKAYIVSCVNSRVDDLAAAADVIRGLDPASTRRVAEGVELYIAAASSEVEATSRERGDWQVLMDAGAIPLPSGCGPCVGLGKGLLKDGEVGISATNRNFKGRMGSRTSEAYLGSPAVVAASAVAGIICGPNYLGEFSEEDSVPEFQYAVHGPVQGEEDEEAGEGEGEGGASDQASLVGGFPETIVGEALFCHQDNLNTDGIFAGTHTYKENLTDADMAKFVMENYDPTFATTVNAGDILVGGFNFGCGSSREQAATALRSCGVDVIVAGSFSETFKRNAFNNGVLCIESPQLVAHLLDTVGTDILTVRTKLPLKLDFKRKTIVLSSGKDDPRSMPAELTLKMPPLSGVAQELIVAGSLEAWIDRFGEMA